MRLRTLVISLSFAFTVAACGGKAKPAAPAVPTPSEPAPTDPELVCCTIASAGDLQSGMVPVEDCPEENRTPDACGNE
jgi:hypothetical protein